MKSLLQTFLQKNLFTKSLQKGFLPKVLLLVVLFFGGCSTASNDAIDIVKNRQGTYYTSKDSPETFEIDADGLKYIDNGGDELAYSSSGADSIEYVGFISSTYIRVVLSDITDSHGGTRTEYDKDGKETYTSGFTWYKSN